MISSQWLIDIKFCLMHILKFIKSSLTFITSIDKSVLHEIYKK